jgi:hypothetical protein
MKVELYLPDDWERLLHNFMQLKGRGSTTMS